MRQRFKALRVGDFVAVNPSSSSEFWIAEVRECFLEMNALKVVWWTRFRKDGKSLIRKDHRAYQRDDGHHSSIIRVAAMFGILEDYELGIASENATSFMKNSKNDRGLKEKHKPGDEDNESTKPTLIIGKKELERLRCMAKKHGMHCARACRRRVRESLKVLMKAAATGISTMATARLKKETPPQGNAHESVLRKQPSQTHTVCQIQWRRICVKSCGA